MRKIILMTESGTDLPPALAKQHNIHVIPMHLLLGDKDYPDGSIPVTEVYDYYKRTGKLPTTSAVNPDEYEKAYRRINEENPDCIILHISYSSKASCTYQNALIASEGMDNVYHIDSLNVTGGEAAIVLKAAELILKHGDLSISELIEMINSYVSRTRTSFIPGSLEYLRAGGRVSNATYLGASILNIKPLIEIVDGKLISTKKYRGSMFGIIDKYMEEFLERHRMEKEHLYFIYSVGLEERIKQKMEEIAKIKGFLNVTWIQTGCVISTHGGPGAVGLAGFAG